MLIKFNRQEVKFYSAVYIDDEKNCHEEYWFVAVYDRIDGVDKNLSAVSEKIGNNVVVDKYVLDQIVLDQAIKVSDYEIGIQSDLDNSSFIQFS